MQPALKKKRCVLIVRIKYIDSNDGVDFEIRDLLKVFLCGGVMRDSAMMTSVLIF